MAETMPIEFVPGVVIEMRAPTEEQVAVVYTTLRSAERNVQNAEQYARAMEVYFRFLSRLIVKPEDKDLLDDALMDGKVTFKNVSDAVESVVGGLNDKPAKPPVKRTRRAR